MPSCREWTLHGECWAASAPRQLQNVLPGWWLALQHRDTCAGIGTAVAVVFEQSLLREQLLAKLTSSTDLQTSPTSAVLK